MDKMRLAVLVVAVVVIAAVLAMTRAPTSEGGKATVIISTNYGAEVILKKEVGAGQSALDALKSVANVSTSYGGEFVTGINGINSNPAEKKDWFYYINGFLANVGAKDYVLRDGDVMRWDYHSWGNTPIITAELEDFPAMFTKGYGGSVKETIVAYDPEHREMGERIANYLRSNGASVVLKPADSVGEERERDNVIIVGQNSSLFTEINNNSALPLPFRMIRGEVVDWHGFHYSGAYAEMIQSPFNPRGTQACENVVLIIAGNDENMEKCVDALLDGDAGFWVLVGERK